VTRRNLFVDGDPNSAWSRRYHDLAVRHTINLGGKDLLSAAQMSLSCGRPPWDVSWSRWREECRLANRSTSTASAAPLRTYAVPLETLGLERWARDAALSCLANASFSPLRARLAAEAEDAEATERATATAFNCQAARL
jgi:hypothetical protein